MSMSEIERRESVSEDGELEVVAVPDAEALRSAWDTFKEAQQWAIKQMWTEPQRGIYRGSHYLGYTIVCEILDAQGERAAPKRSPLGRQAESAIL